MYVSFIKIVEEKEQEQKGMKYGAGVLIFCPKSGRFLLQKRGPSITDPGQHDYFGGGVDEGESITGAAIRELYEEGGILVSDPATLYKLAIYGRNTGEGLGGYHIFLRIADDEFEGKPSYEGDSNDEVESADWIGKDEMSQIHLHERVSTLFADKGFKDSLIKAYRLHSARDRDAVDKYA